MGWGDLFWVEVVEYRTRGPDYTFSFFLFFALLFTCGLFTLLWSSSVDDILGSGRYVCVSSDLDMDLGCGRGYY